MKRLPVIKCIVKAWLQLDNEELGSETVVKIQEGTRFSSYNLWIPGFPWWRLRKRGVEVLEKKNLFLNSLLQSRSK